MRTPQSRVCVRRLILALALSAVGLRPTSANPRPALPDPAGPPARAGQFGAAPIAPAHAPAILHVPKDFPTIQAAVDAASPGSVILVLPGTYVEQVVINKNLKLIGFGAGATIIRAPSTLVQGAFGRTSIVEINSGAKVRMSGLTVSGPGPGSCLTGDGLNRGIAVVDDATLDLSFAAVTHIHDTPVLADCFRDGNGIAIGAIFTGSTGHATIVDVNISDYQAAGITLFEPGSTATISHNVISGPGPSTAAFPSGIDFGFGAVATITQNVISRNLCDSVDLLCGPDPLTQFQASAIGPVDAGAGTVIAFNTLVNNDIGLYLYGSPDAISSSHNALLNNRYFGLAIQDGDNTSSFDRIMGGQIGVGVIADSVDTVGTLDHEFIGPTSVTRIKEISSGGYTATAVVAK